MTKREVAEMAGVVNVLWPHRGLPPEWIEAAAPLLADIPVELAREAVARLALTSTFPPSIAEIIHGAGAGRPSAEVALATVIRHGGEGLPPTLAAEIRRDFGGDYAIRTALETDATNPRHLARTRALIERWYDHPENRRLLIEEASARLAISRGGPEPAALNAGALTPPKETT